jgi:probable HAF family extracellular repeat protein
VSKRSSAIRACLAAASLFLGVSVAAVGAPPSYRVTLLSSLGGFGNFCNRPTGLSDDGTVLYLCDRISIIWDPEHGARTLDSVVGGAVYTGNYAPKGVRLNRAGVNNRGAIVGTVCASGQPCDYQNPGRAFYFDPESGLRPLETHPGAVRSYATDINDDGVVVGLSAFDDGLSRGFIWDRVNGFRDVGLLPAEQSSPIPLTLNGSGTWAGTDLLAGWSPEHGQVLQAIWQAPGDAVTFPYEAAEEPFYSVAEAINDSGKSVGSCWYNDGRSYACAYSREEGLIPLTGTQEYYLFPTAYDINNHGQIVGDDWDEATQRYYGFLYEDGQRLKFHDLIEPEGNPLQSVHSLSKINDRGAVAGLGFDGTNTLQVFIATPISGERLLTPASPQRRLPDHIGRAIHSRKLSR